MKEAAEIRQEPIIPQGVIDWLNNQFPKKDFDTSTSLREMDYHNGQRSVVRFLYSKLEEQNDNILTRKPEG